MSKVLTISGQRGGSGKSVTALNLAVSLSLYEKKVLLIDCDPHGCVSDWSGIGSMAYPFDLSSVLNGKSSTIEAISNTEFACLDILPAGFDLFQAALKLSRMAANEKILRLLIADIRSDYDYIILDAPSSYGYMSITAMTAADWLIVATSSEENWVEDFHSLLKSIQYIRNTHDTALRIGGLLFNRCSDTDAIQRRLSGRLSEETKNLIYDTMIPQDEAVDLSINKKMPLALNDIKSPAADSYLRAAREVILAFN